MATFAVENQWGGTTASWNPAGVWDLGARPNQNVIAINVSSDDDGQTLSGTMTYANEGPIGFRGTKTAQNTYTVEAQWGGEYADWNPDGTWVIGDRAEQSVVNLEVTSSDDGKTLTGTMTYGGEGPIGFRGSLQ